LIADRIERKWQIVIGAAAPRSSACCFSTVSAAAESGPVRILGDDFNIVLRTRITPIKRELYLRASVQSGRLVYSFSRLATILSGFRDRDRTSRFRYDRRIRLHCSSSHRSVSRSISALGPATRADTEERH